MENNNFNSNKNFNYSNNNNNTEVKTAAITEDVDVDVTATETESSEKKGFFETKTGKCVTYGVALTFGGVGLGALCRKVSKNKKEKVASKIALAVSVEAMKMTDKDKKAKLEKFVIDMNAYINHYSDRSFKEGCSDMFLGGIKKFVEAEYAEISGVISDEFKKVLEISISKL